MSVFNIDAGPWDPQSPVLEYHDWGDVKLSPGSYPVQNLLLYLDVHRVPNGIEARAQKKLPTVIMGPVLEACRCSS